MNVSAPVSIPDLAGLLLLMAAPPDTKASIPGSAPTQSAKTGAETLRSFESALADLLSAGDNSDSKPEDKPEVETNQQEAKALITGVTIPLPAPAPPHAPLHFELTLTAQPAANVEPDALSVHPELVAGTPRTTPTPPPFRKTAAFAQGIPDTPIPFGVDIPTPASPLPRPSPGDAEPAPVSAVTDATIVPDLAPAAELAHPAFAEKFTPAPVPAPAQSHTSPASQPMPQANGKSQDVAKADGAPPEQPVTIATPERAPEQRHGDTRGDHDSHQRPAGEQGQPSRTEAEPAGQPRFEPAVAISASSRPAVPHSDAASPAAAPAPKPSDIQHADIEPAHMQPVPAVQTGDAHTISLRVTDAGDQKVELKITDHGGEVKVAVRAADPELAGSLRENLGDLVHKLEQSGLRAENWHPSATDSNAGPRQTSHAEGESFNGDHSGRQQQNQGDGRDRRQQDRQDRPAWLEEFETSFTPDSERSTIPWLPASVR